MVQFDDLVRGWMRRALKWQDVLTDFEAASQILPLRETLNREGLHWRIDGGYDEAERVRLFLTMREDDITRQDMHIHVIRYSGNMKFTSFSHRDCLGALMSLGFERKCIGDILVRDTGFDVLTNGEIDDFLLTNDLRVRHVPMHAEQVALDDWQPPQVKLKEEVFLVAQLRCDALLAGAFKLSRAQSARLVSSGSVQIDHLICQRPDKIVEEGQTLSVRGYGKFVLLSVEGTSKKGKTRVKIGKYI